MLAKIPKKPSIKTPEQLDAEIDEILGTSLFSKVPVERYEVANALGYRYPKRPPPKKSEVTDLNISALASQVMEGGEHATFSNRIPQVHYPHIKRCMAAGLVEVTPSKELRLTDEGRKAVLASLRDDYASLRKMFDKYESTEPSRFTARDRQDLRRHRDDRRRRRHARDRRPDALSNLIGSAS